MSESTSENMRNNKQFGCENIVDSDCILHSAQEYIERAGKASRKAAFFLKKISSDKKNEALERIANMLVLNSEKIIKANSLDLDKARSDGMSAGLIDRLMLTEDRIKDIANSVRNIAMLPDPIGKIVRGAKMPNGLKVTSVAVPLGVVGVIYEARPNVTVDTLALCLKSGNSVFLRGGRAAFNTNMQIVKIIKDALCDVNFPEGVLTSMDEFGREGSIAMMKAHSIIDVLIPRGGSSLIKTVVEHSKVPVIETGTGNCHVYVDSSADIEKAVKIVMNSKTQRVGVCNAAETLLVHDKIASKFLPVILKELANKNVTVHGCNKTELFARNICDLHFVNATEQDWAREYLSLDLAVRVVNDIDEAIEHINTYSSGHTEAICAYDLRSVEKFKCSIDCATIAVNASTRFTDGGQFGLGAEIGISTQKMHARGPMGLEALTTVTWIVEGDGTIRK